MPYELYVDSESVKEVLEENQSSGKAHDRYLASVAGSRENLVGCGSQIIAGIAGTLGICYESLTAPPVFLEGGTEFLHGCDADGGSVYAKERELDARVGGSGAKGCRCIEDAYGGCHISADGRDVERRSRFLALFAEDECAHIDVQDTFAGKDGGL